MIFLPNKIERYCALLRNSLHSRALNSGINSKILKTLSKIHLIEAINYNQKEPISLDALLRNLLNSASIILIEKNKHFSFRITGNGDYLINKMLFYPLILTICNCTTHLIVDIKNDKLILKFWGRSSQETKKITKLLNGVLLKEVKTNENLICIPLCKTHKKSQNNKKDWEDFRNPFSVINIYLNM